MMYFQHAYLVVWVAAAVGHNGVISLILMTLSELNVNLLTNKLDIDSNLDISFPFIL